jgi:hypothetical protein
MDSVGVGGQRTVDRDEGGESIWGIDTIEFAETEDMEERDLVPDSLRHFMITQRIINDLNFK